ncbi:hypothetical protein GCM10028820_02570 [Tessaracoccus terricola]
MTDAATGMSPLLLALALVGAVAVVTFVVFVVVGASKGWSDPGAKGVLRAFFLLAAVCAVLGVVVGLTSGG